MKKINFSAFLLICLFTSTYAHEYRNLLQKEADIPALKKVLILNQKWVNYPDYQDRAGWDAMTQGLKQALIQKGEEALTYEWKVIKATDYMEFERSGSRNIMQQPFGANNTALTDLVKAELAEGKGRFMDQIINGIWLSCEMTSWVLSAHTKQAQEENTSLPGYQRHIIDLTAGDLGSFLSWTYYFLKDELDKINPLVAPRLRKNLQERILDPYVNRSDFWWQATDASPTTMVNNWNPWCNFNVLSCYLLLEDDPDKLAAAVHRSMVSVDQFINYNNNDGACEEGPSYWGHAAGKMYDFLQLLHTATAGKVSIFDEAIIKNMGEYIARSYVGDGWVVNFADASARGSAKKGVVFRYGQAVNSMEMQQFAAYLYHKSDLQTYLTAGRDMYRALEDLRSFTELKKTKPALPQTASSWYPETEFCYMRNEQGFFFAAKGGYNGESHNHNDMGTFSLYLYHTPMLIDAGVGTYTRQTFSSERYSIWTMQSEYHNLPMINGVAQRNGSKYRSKDVKFNDKKSTFSLDLADAYPASASVDKWARKYQLQKKGGLLIEDDFKLATTTQANQLNFLSWGKPNVSVAGQVIIEKEDARVKLSYDSSQFAATVERIPLPDSRLSRVWGAEIYRLSLTARKLQVKGKYKILVEADRP